MILSAGILRLIQYFCLGWVFLQYRDDKTRIKDAVKLRKVLSYSRNDAFPVLSLVVCASNLLGLSDCNFIDMDT